MQDSTNSTNQTEKLLIDQANAVNTLILSLTSLSFFTGVESWVAAFLSGLFLTIGLCLVSRFPRVHLNVKVIVFSLWLLHLAMLVDATYQLVALRR